MGSYARLSTWMSLLLPVTLPKPVREQISETNEGLPARRCACQPSVETPFSNIRRWERSGQCRNEVTEREGNVRKVAFHAKRFELSFYGSLLPLAV